MALEDILLAIEKQGDADCAAIQAESERTFQSIREEAERKASDQKLQIFSETETRLADVRRARLSKTRRDARKKVRLALQSLMEEAILHARASLEQARKRVEYPEFLRQCILESSAAMNGDCVLLVDPRDLALAHQNIAGISPVTEVRPELKCFGGIVAASEDGKVRVMNTLETRLSEVIRRNRSNFVRRFLQGATEESKWMEVTNMAIPG